jgi:hypothetical protein
MLNPQKPFHVLVAIAQGGAPPGPRKAFDRWRLPGARQDKRSILCEIHHL